MNTGRNGLLVERSVHLYRLFVRAYPKGFAARFGDEMVQVFRDAARERYASGGVRGLASFWLSTMVDAFKSVVDTHAEESRSMDRNTFAAVLLFGCALIGTLGYGAMRFGEFYDAPAFSRFGAESADETTLLAAYGQALQGEYGDYRAFASTGTFAASILLGFGAGLFGIGQKSILRGTMAFVVGAASGVAVLSAMPSLWFPLDRYSVAAVWVMGALPFAAIVFTVATAIGFFRRSVQPRAA